jgi:microcystin-dependent protein
MTGGEDIVVIQRGFGVAVTGTVGTNSLVDGSVTNIKLASGAVTSDKISTTDTNFNVQSDGKVGIGTASPQHILDVRSSEDLTTFVNNQTPGVGIKNENAAVDNVALLAFKGSLVNSALAGVGMINRAVTTASVSSVGDLAFYSKPLGQEDLNDDPSMLIDYAGNVGIGTTTPAYALDVTGDLNITGDYKVNGTNLQTVPTGTVSAFAGSSAPTGYLLCDGSPVNRTTYAALASVLEDPSAPGTYIYGSGDGSTTFNLPDLRGRVVAGLGESLLGATADTLGEDNGLIADTKEHTLSIDEIPSHQHKTDGTDGGDNHAVRKGSDAPIDATSQTVNANDAYYKTGSLTGTAGSGQAHNNVQPTIILNYIIKT